VKGDDGTYSFLSNLDLRSRAVAVIPLKIAIHLADVLSVVEILLACAAGPMQAIGMER
jgi:hypothetical protein